MTHTIPGPPPGAAALVEGEAVEDEDFDVVEEEVDAGVDALEEGAGAGVAGVALEDPDADPDEELEEPEVAPPDADLSTPP